jgi:glutaminyl-tRNA synthetase
MAAERNDFIRDIIDEDLRTGRYTRVATRFPPEPNGYLHIGHAKAICVDFGIARDYQGTCNLRYDDTNPTKEDVEYVESIERDVRWLGFEPAAVLFSADYFPRMYELAERLVREGKAYVDDLGDEQIKEYRGTLSEPGKPSPYRDRSVDENLTLLRKMKAGEFPDGARVLRAKIDLASPNMKMRDPLLYRIRHAHHHRTGDEWVIYPMYDYAHPIEDAIEGITHSLCTLEFENNRELYDWVIENTGPWNPRPRQYEFARLALEYTVMSKRKLRQLVEDGHVRGWDDPRMPTLAALRRRGYSPEAIRAFCDLIGVAKANSMVDIGKLEYCVRDDLNQNAPRALGVLRPIEVEVSGDIGATEVDAPYFPPDVGKPGTRKLPVGARIFIDRDDWSDNPPSDWKRLGPGRTVRLRHAYCITADEVVARDHDGHVTKLRAHVASSAKGAGVIHWVDAATSVPAEVRLYERLFKVPRPEEGGGDFLEHLDPHSLEVVTTARLEKSLASAEVGSRWQLERVGYFIVDEDTRPGALVLARIITLRDERIAVAAAPAEKKENVKAKTRPRSKSPQEYRAEARARDAELAAAYAKAQSLGLSAEQADLVTGDRDTASLFTETAAKAGNAQLVAKWMINELPRALAGKELAGAKLDAARFADFIALVAGGTLPGSAAKTVLAEMVATGKPASEVGAAAAAAQAISPAELEAKVEAVIRGNLDKWNQYRAGKDGLRGFFVGQVMKSTPNADAAAVSSTLDKLRTTFSP